MWSKGNASVKVRRESVCELFVLRGALVTTIFVLIYVSTSSATFAFPALSCSLKLWKYITTNMDMQLCRIRHRKYLYVVFPLVYLDSNSSKYTFFKDR